MIKLRVVTVLDYYNEEGFKIQYKRSGWPFWCDVISFRGLGEESWVEKRIKNKDGSSRQIYLLSRYENIDEAQKGVSQIAEALVDTQAKKFKKTRFKQRVIPPIIIVEGL